MPIAEFYCEVCNEITELVLTRKQYDETDGIICPACESQMPKIPSVCYSKLGGEDNTWETSDELTLGKLVANRGVPSEFKKVTSKRYLQNTMDDDDPRRNAVKKAIKERKEQAERVKYGELGG